VSRGRTWRLVGLGAAGEPAAFSGPDNMALDQALLESVQAGGLPALRLYRWNPPCLSLGRNQPARGFHAALEAGGAVAVVRRPTGGMAVLHDRELTYAVVLPVGELGGPRDSYVAINCALAAGLQRLGVPARLAAGGAVGRPRAGPCFSAAAPGEVVAAGRKLVGSAQRRIGRALLQHGSILIEGDQTAAGAGAGPAASAGHGGPVPTAESRPAVLAELLGRQPAWPELTAAIVAGFQDVLGIRLAPGPVSPEEAERAAAHTLLYASADWTWRH
jgi:lipoyl(octanoyl) transferase